MEQRMVWSSRGWSSKNSCRCRCRCRYRCRCRCSCRCRCKNMKWIMPRRKWRSWGRTKWSHHKWISRWSRRGWSPEEEEGAALEVMTQSLLDIIKFEFILTTLLIFINSNKIYLHYSSLRCWNWSFCCLNWPKLYLVSPISFRTSTIFAQNSSISL